MAPAGYTSALSQPPPESHFVQPRRRFRFIRELAEGGFGKVYLAEMVTGDDFSTVVAIKLLHGKWTTHEEIAQRSRDEARLLGLLRHRNIVRVEDLTSIRGQCAVIMEYLEGVDLKTLVNYLVGRGEAFPLRSVFEVTGAVASALNAAYSHVPLQGGEPLRLIHRDIKPSNVMLTAEGDVKLLDFGTARANFEQREAHTQALAFGSQAYMAPERLLGDPDTPAADVFSLGITTFEVIAGGAFGKIHIRPERYAKSMHDRIDSLHLGTLGPDLQDRVRHTLKLMLAYEPEERPSSAQVIEIMEILGDEARDEGLRRFSRRAVRPAMEAHPHQGDGGPTLAGSTVFEDRSAAVDADGIPASSSGSVPAQGGEQTFPFGDVQPQRHDGLQAMPTPPPILEEGATALPSDELSEPDDPDWGRVPNHLVGAQSLPAQSTFDEPLDGPVVEDAPALSDDQELIEAATAMADPEEIQRQITRDEQEEAEEASYSVDFQPQSKLDPQDWSESAETVVAGADEIARLEAALGQEPAAQHPAVPDSAASDEPSGEPSGEPSDEPSGEPSGEPEAPGHTPPPPQKVEIVWQAPPPPPDPTPEAEVQPPTKGGGKGLLIGLVVLVVLSVVGLGGAFAMGLIGGPQVEAPVGPKDPVPDLAPQPDVPDGVPDADPEVQADPVREAAPQPTEDAGVVELTIFPAQPVTLTISSSLGFKEVIEGRGSIALGDLAEGIYRTKVAFDGGTSRGTVDVVKGQTCRYRVNLGDGGDWEPLGCE